MLTVEVARLNGGPLASATTVGAGLLLFFGVACLVPLAGAMESLAQRDPPSAPDWLKHAGARTPSFVLLWGIIWLARGVLALLFGIVGTALVAQLAGDNEARRSLAALAVGLLTAAALALLTIVQDLARGALVQGGVSVRAALGAALRWLRRHPLDACGFWLALSLWSLAGVLAAAWLTEQLAVHRGDSWRLIAVFFVHQAAVALSVLSHATWLSYCISSGGAAHRLPVDLLVAPGGTVPGQVTAHDPAPQGAQLLRAIGGHATLHRAD
jgi:hypothetical protein